MKYLYLPLSQKIARPFARQTASNKEPTASHKTEAVFYNSPPAIPSILERNAQYLDGKIKRIRQERIRTLSRPGRSGGFPVF